MIGLDKGGERCMNKKGQVIMYGLMLGLVIIILALAFTGPVKTFVDNARNTTSEFGNGLDCNNASIADYNKAACLSTDFSLPYFIGILIFIGGAVVIAKIIFT